MVPKINVPDKLAFTRYTTPNGIEVYQRYIPHANRTNFEVLCPAGSLSRYEDEDIENIPNGTQHALEHILMGYSAYDPNRHHALWQDVALAGGDLRAYTSPYYTMFRLVLPNMPEVAYLQRGLATQIRSPIFKENDLEEEKQIIKEEINESGRFGIFGSEIHWHMYTQWTSLTNFTADNMLGTSSDVDKITVHNLHQLHPHLLSNGMTVIASGGTIEPLLEELSQIPLRSSPLERLPIHIEWETTEFHEKTCTHPSLREKSSLVLGTLVSPHTSEHLTFLNILGDFLTHPQVGILSNGYCKDTPIQISWVCDTVATNKLFFRIRLEAPLAYRDYLKRNRQDILDYIFSNFSADTLNRYIDENRYAFLGKYNTVESQVNTAVEDFRSLNEIRNQTHINTIKEKFRDPNYVINMWNNHMSEWNSLMFLPQT